MKGAKAWLESTQLPGVNMLHTLSVTLQSSVAIAMAFIGSLHPGQLPPLVLDDIIFSGFPVQQQLVK